MFSRTVAPGIELRLFELADAETVLASVERNRAYLRQWIASPTYQGDDIDRLRRRVNGLLSREDVSQWLDEAENVGIDPL